MISTPTTRPVSIHAGTRLQSRPSTASTSRLTTPTTADVQDQLQRQRDENQALKKQLQEIQQQDKLQKVKLAKLSKGLTADDHNTLEMSDLLQRQQQQLQQQSKKLQVLTQQQQQNLKVNRPLRRPSSNGIIRSTSNRSLQSSSSKQSLHSVQSTPIVQQQQLQQQYYQPQNENHNVSHHNVTMSPSVYGKSPPVVMHHQPYSNSFHQLPTPTANDSYLQLPNAANQLYSTQQSPQPSTSPHPATTQLQSELHTTKSQILSLQQQFEQLAMNYRVEKQITAKSLLTIENLNMQLNTTKQELQSKTQQLTLLEDNTLQMEHLNSIIGDLKSDLQQSEHRVKLLQTSLYDGDLLETQRMEKLMNEYNAQISKLRSDLQAKDQKLLEFRSTLGESIENLTIQSQQLSEMRQHKQRLEQECQMHKQRISEVEKEVHDLTKTTASDSVQVQALKQRLQQSEATIQQQSTEIDNLKLQLQMQVEVHQQVQIQNNQEKSHLLRMSQQMPLQQVMPSLRGSVDTTDNPLEDSMFLMSELGDSFYQQDTSTVIAVRATTAIFNTKHYVFSRYKQTPPITLLALDFYDYETSYSSLHTGFTPNYNFLSQYPLTIDPLVLQYLQNDSLQIYLYVMEDEMKYTKVGVAQVKLHELLNVTASSTQKVKMYVDSGADKQGGSSEHVCEIELILRMQRPIVEASQPPSPTKQPASTSGKPPMNQQQRPSIAVRRQHSMNEDDISQLAAIASSARQSSAPSQEPLTAPFSVRQPSPSSAM